MLRLPVWSTDLLHLMPSPPLNTAMNVTARPRTGFFYVGEFECPQRNRPPSGYANPCGPFPSLPEAGRFF